MPQIKSGAAGTVAAPHAAPVRVLVLGGSGEARRLAARIAEDRRFAAVISLAGRTSAPLEQNLPVRVGGFGGVEGLVRYLVEERIEKVIDATHPFAARMSANALEACARLGVPLLAFSRAPWERVAGDRWTEVVDNGAAVAALGASPRRVFLTTGRMGLADFSAAAQHFYLIRAIERPLSCDLPPLHALILERGPFTVESELSLMRETQVDTLVTKNSGGEATYAKIEAARRLGLDVVMIARPGGEAGRIAHRVEEAIAFLAEERRA
jgi:precorrin-6A/cobalt-precorrin-6A reductase